MLNRLLCKHSAKLIKTDWTRQCKSFLYSNKNIYILYIHATFVLTYLSVSFMSNVRPTFKGIQPSLVLVAVFTV